MIAAYQLQFVTRSPGTTQNAIKITFPADSGISASSLSCSTTSGSFTTTTPPCIATNQADGSFVVIVQGLRSGQMAYQVTITGIKNPPSAKPVSGTQCQSCFDALCQSFTDTAQAPLLTFLPLQVSENAISARFLNPYNGEEKSTIVVSYTINGNLLEKGTIRLGLPKRNQKYLGKGTFFQDPLIPDQVGSTPGPFTVKVEEYDVGTTTRTEIPQLKSPIFQYVVGFNEPGIDIVTIYLNNPSIITAPKTLDITISPVKNPPSTNPITGFTVLTGDKDLNSIDSCKGGAVNTDQPGEFSIKGSVSKLEILDSNTKVGASKVMFDVLLFPKNDVPRYSKIKLTFPKDWPIGCPQIVSCSAGCSLPSGGMICDSIGNSVQLTQGFETENSYSFAGTPIQFKVGEFINPMTTELRYVTVETFQSDNGINYIIDRYVGFGLTFTPGDIVTESILPTDKMIYSDIGKYQLKFYCQHPVLIDSQLTIVWPKTIEVQNKASCNAVGLAGAVCIASPNEGKMVITNFVANAGQQLDFTLDTITNPGKYTSPGVVTFELRVRLGGLVDAGSYEIPPNLYGPSFIESFDVLPLNYTAGWQPATYQFTVRPKARVAQGSYLKINIPRQVTVSDSYSMEVGCARSNNALSGFSNNRIQCLFDQLTNILTVRNGFAYGDTEANPPILKFQVPYFRNPRAIFKTDMYNVTIYTEDGKPLFWFNNTIGPTVQMTGQASPGGISYTRSSYVNGVMTDYTWSVKSSNYLEDGDTMLLTLPQPISFTKDTKCKSETYLLRNPIQCTLSRDLGSVNITIQAGDNVRFLLEDSNLDYVRPRRNLRVIPANSILVFTLTNVTSPPSNKPAVGSVSYRVNTKDGYPMESLSSGISIQNTEVQVMEERFAGVKPSSFIKNRSANYTVVFSPVNFETEMQIIYWVPKSIKINPNLVCRGISGTSQTDLTCVPDYYKNTVTIINAAYGMESKPDNITVLFSTFVNPENNIVTDTFRIYTMTKDKFDMDKLEQGLNLNFYCTYPCKTCNQTQPDQCYSCYFGTSLEIYLYQDQCLQSCPDGMYEQDDVVVPTCQFCDSPCKTCGKNAKDCETCIEGYLLYKIDNTCYREINWYFPFLGSAVIIFLLTLMVECCCKDTEFLIALLCFLCFVENAVFGYLGYLYFKGEVLGDRSLTIVSLVSMAMLNFFFIIVHTKSIMKNASGEYQQVMREFKCSSWTISVLAYLLNFKFSLFLISNFAERPRFSGTFNAESWKSFNTFSVLYIVLVYLPFTGDFYLYFTTYGLRQLTSYVAIEAVGIQTIIVLLLTLEILEQCACSGMREEDFGKRAGLFNSKKSKKKRRALRSGMGNDEDDYGDEYFSEEDYDSEIEEISLEEEEESYYDEEDDEDGSTKGKRKRKSKVDDKKTQQHLDMLEALALEMKKQKDLMAEEQQKMRDEQKRQAAVKKKQEAGWAKEREQLRKDVAKVKGRQEELPEEVDKKIAEELAKRREEEARRKEESLKAPIVRLNDPVKERVDLSKSLEGDEEYWLQNITPCNDSVGEEPEDFTKDASEVNFIDNETAHKSYIGTPRVAEEEQEMRANVSQKNIPVGEDASQIPSMNATEENYINQSQSGIYSNLAGGDKDLTKSQLGLTDGKDGAVRQMQATEIDQMEQRSADFGEVSALDANGSQENFLNKSDAAFGRNSQKSKMMEEEKVLQNSIEDKEGHSDESSEGIVADHTPFNGIRDAIAKQEEHRRQQQDEAASDDELDSEAQGEDGQIPGADGTEAGKTRRIKQVLYSDKSESSVDDMMEDTPSNYNIANGRLEGKSMGLKAILLFAKNQGIQLGAKQPLPQIQEEANMTGTNLNRQSSMQSSGEMGRNWKPMNNPMTGDRRTQIVGQDELQINSRTIDDGGQQKGKKPTKRNPGAKNFQEDQDQQDLKKLQKNNFV